MATQAAPFKLALRHQNKLLVNYQLRLQQQQRLLEMMKAVLPDALKNHADYCVMSNRKILLYTTSSVWASQLRFYNNVLLKAILKSQQNAHIETIQIRILTSTPSSITALRQPKIPSGQIIKQIGEARTEQMDSLSQALAALSKTLEKKRSAQ